MGDKTEFTPTVPFTYSANVSPGAMTDREIAEETLHHMRNLMQGLSQLLPVVEQFGKNPMAFFMGQRG